MCIQFRGDEMSADGEFEDEWIPEVWDDASQEVPATSRKLRRAKRDRPRGKTIAVKRLTRAVMREGALASPPMDDADRPKTRAQCQGEQRPCPWVACKHHLYLDINPVTGSIKLNFPDLEPWELTETCALDVAERGSSTLDEIGAITNLTRERIRQLEVRGLAMLRTLSRQLQ